MVKRCIFAKSEILSELQVLDEEYQRVYLKGTPRSLRLMKIYSRMAVIDLCGWIEDGLKGLSSLSIDKLKERRRQKSANDFIDRINGFKYDNHFSRVLMMTFGVHGFEFIESKVGDTDIAKLGSILGKLKIWRDDTAHSYVTIIPCNPGQIIKEMNVIFPILKSIENSARNYKKKHF